MGIIALLIYEHRDVPKYTYIYLGRGSRDMTKELSEGVVITQKVPYYTGDWGLSFIFTNFGHRVFGDLTVRAVGQDSGFVYIDRTVSGKEIRNNEYIDFLFP